MLEKWVDNLEILIAETVNNPTKKAYLQGKRDGFREALQAKETEMHVDTPTVIMNNKFKIKCDGSSLRISAP